MVIVSMEYNRDTSNAKIIGNGEVSKKPFMAQVPSEYNPRMGSSAYADVTTATRIIRCV